VVGPRRVGADMPPFGMYVIMALRSAVPGVPVHSSPTAKRSRTSQNDVGGTRGKLAATTQTSPAYHLPATNYLYFQ
jgi:hypothetical protein